MKYFELNRSCDVILDNDLVDAMKPGDRVQITGCYRYVDAPLSTIDFYPRWSFRHIKLSSFELKWILADEWFYLYLILSHIDSFILGIRTPNFFILRDSVDNIWIKLIIPFGPITGLFTKTF